MDPMDQMDQMDGFTFCGNAEKSILSIRSIHKRHAAGRGYKQLCYRAPFYTDKQTALTARECNIELLGIEADCSLEKFADDFCRVLDNGKHTAICFPVSDL